MTTNNQSNPNLPVLKILKYIFGILSIMAFFGGIIQKQFSTSFIFLVLGILLLPPVSDQLKDKFKIWQNKWMRYITYVFLLFIVGAISDKNKSSNTTLKPEISQEAKPEIPIKENSKVTETGNSGVYNANGEKVGTVSNVQKEKPMDDSDFWENYSSKVKTRIHKLIQEEDCAGLQQEFDIAGDNNLAQKRRTGTGNVELMDFIDENMKEMGCYGKR